MNIVDRISRPSKLEQRNASESYNNLYSILSEIKDDNPEMEIEETKEKIRIPLFALKLLSKILKATADGKPVSIVPIETEMTTQAAAELLGCSRPHLVKLLEKGEIRFTKVGKHRRVKFEDVMTYKKALKVKQEKLISQMMESDEELGLY